MRAIIGGAKGPVVACVKAGAFNMSIILVPNVVPSNMFVCDAQMDRRFQMDLLVLGSSVCDWASVDPVLRDLLTLRVAKRALCVDGCTDDAFKRLYRYAEHRAIDSKE